MIENKAIFFGNEAPLVLAVKREEEFCRLTRPTRVSDEGVYVQQKVAGQAGPCR